MFRAELELCDRWGIPHSRFRGGDGRWTRLDRAKALAYRDYQRSVCPQCGTRAEEWQDDEDAYAATVQKCPGCEVIADTQAGLPQSEHGLKVGLIPASVRAALDAERALKEKTRRRRGDGDEQ